MTSQADQVLSALSDAVVGMDEKLTATLSVKAVEQDVDALTAIEHGLVDGMNRAGILFEKEEYFIPELLLCSDAMYAGLDILRPHLKNEENKERLKIVIGVVEAIRTNASVIALSTLMTTTMDGMADVIKLLKKENVRDRFKVIIGGGPISQAFADKIGADGYSAGAPAAVKLVKNLLGETVR